MEAFAVKNRQARHIGMGFFLLLSGAYLIAEVFSGHFSWHDLVPFALVMLPAAVDNRVGYLLFAGVAMLISAFVTLEILIEGVGFWTTIIPATVAFTGVLASSLVIYSCTSVSERSFRF